jgi:hypothetical protein
MVHKNIIFSFLLFFALAVPTVVWGMDDTDDAWRPEYANLVEKYRNKVQANIAQDYSIAANNEENRKDLIELIKQYEAKLPYDLPYMYAIWGFDNEILDAIVQLKDNDGRCAFHINVPYAWNQDDETDEYYDGMTFLEIVLCRHARVGSKNVRLLEDSLKLIKTLVQQDLITATVTKK